MTTKYLSYGSMINAVAYDDAGQYPDGEYFEGARADQVLLDVIPSNPKHAVTKSHLDSIVTSQAALISTLDSRVTAGGH